MFIDNADNIYSGRDISSILVSSICNIKTSNLVGPDYEMMF